MSETILPEEVTKYNYRKKIWDFMKKNELANFPLSIYNRIPNFKGATEAAQRLAELEEFRNAKVIKIKPDKSQEPIRALSLEANKEILVPIPRLKSGLFLHITPTEGATKEQIKFAATRHGLQQNGKPLGITSKIKVDLVVLGSVCVSKAGYRIGKGEGFADLEFAIMLRMGAIDKNTVVVTTVHDCQVIDDLPSQLFQEHDVPVDIIVTPTQTIVVNPRLQKPAGILWHLLSQRRLKCMQILQELKELEEKEGKIIVLKEVDSDRETRQYEKNRNKKGKNKTRSKAKADISQTQTAVGGNKDIVKPRFPKRRLYHKLRGDGDNPSINEDNGEENDNEKPLRRKPFKPKSKTQIDFSLKLSNIASDVRVRDLKNALSKRGVKPSEISWRGQRGFCYLHFGKLRNGNSLPDQPVQVDSIVANLQQFRINETEDSTASDFIVVEPTKPITRIEVTDVTTV
ncbi:methenyltetrahydrofolate synthase domain-containing protein isoform X2 [Cephus cinctus]|uniref:Methenyltetrahydrofolate synthase domain-containing protein n=1 Tax=Cephus cinctus TaxID=211228 RepID=A0AAJ7BYN1_CEPCN|nr:methenyltetrahydrofolate synthase domain-containing protein isoform X2 [Cephus cinctus]